VLIRHSSYETSCALFICAWLMLTPVLVAGAGDAANAPAPAPAAAAPARPAEWAQPLNVDGVPNLHKVSDGLYRGAQPTAEGMRVLKKLGIKTVLNLRSLHSDRDELAGTGLGYRHLQLKAWHPEAEDAVAFLKIVTDKDLQPVFVHCQQGADRTGLMCAIYRVAVCDWSKEQAAKEMTEGGFGFHAVWTEIVPFLNALDLEKLKKEAGLSTQPADQPAR